jgi:carbon storage regulator
MALVLSRHPEESIILTATEACTIKVTVCEVREGNKVRLAFTAPRTVTIHREEVQEAVDREQRRARPSG